MPGLFFYRLGETEILDHNLTGGSDSFDQYWDRSQTTIKDTDIEHMGSFTWGSIGDYSSSGIAPAFPNANLKRTGPAI